MELLQTLPNEADYTPLAEHQSHTPASFYSGPPVLHCILRGATLTARPSDLHSISALAKLTGIETATEDASEGDTSISGVDVWVASDKLVLSRPTTSLALTIPYRSIALHAVSASGLYVQLSTEAGAAEDEEAADTIEMTLTPATANGAADGERPVDLLFKALSDCADLHPDPHEEGDEDDDRAAGLPSFIINGDSTEDADGALYQITAPAGDSGPSGLPPPMPGSGGWITAENMHEHFDEEGNWKGNGEGQGSGVLGAGAGTVRERDGEDEQSHGQGGVDGDDNKWQRTG